MKVGNEPAIRSVVVDVERDASLVDAVLELLSHWRLIAVGSVLAGAVAAGAAMLMPSIYTGRTTLLPPQQQQNLAGLALGQLGALGALAGTAAGLRGPAEQFVGLMRTETIADRVIDALGLMQVYKTTFREDARRALASRTRVSVDRRDGLISIEVDDRDPNLAAAIANRYVQELRRLGSELAITEAQQRRRFFEAQLEMTRKRLAQSQAELQASGFNQASMRTEPRATAENYARLRAETEAAELQLRALRIGMTDSATEVRRQIEVLSGLRARLAEAEKSAVVPGGPAYVNAYREFKYQEALFELFSKQFELARVDEARDGTLVQVVDPARPAERRSRPKRTEIVVTSTAAAAVLLVLFVLARRSWRRAVATSGGGSNAS